MIFAQPSLMQHTIVAIWHIKKIAPIYETPDGLGHGARLLLNLIK